MQNKRYFKIGEIGELFGLNIRTLRYYDEIGLLKPDHTDPDSGYRYYSTSQFEPLNTIRYLRELDVPLEDIRRFLGSRDVDAMKEMLGEQIRDIEERQRSLEGIRRKLNGRLEQIRAAQEEPLGKVEIHRLPAREALLLRYALKPDSDLEYPIRLLASSHGTRGIFLGMVGLSIDQSRLEENRFEHYDYIFLLPEPEVGRAAAAEEAAGAAGETGDGEAAGSAEEAAGAVGETGDTGCGIFPAGDYAVLRFGGTHQGAADHYRKLVRGIARRGYEICGNSLEITLIDYGMTSDPGNFVTEIQIPVRKK
ncbi:MAG: MerR family transcriptional regulator [Firmicutes bacterium]|nr:MerR family transcriptional regulator [Bacillota bacterium]